MCVYLECVCVCVCENKTKQQQVVKHCVDLLVCISGLLDCESRHILAHAISMTVWACVSVFPFSSIHVCTYSMFAIVSVYLISSIHVCTNVCNSLSY